MNNEKMINESHALKNTANLRPGNPLHILRYPTGNIPSGFPAITCEQLSKWRQNDAYVSEMAPKLSVNVVIISYIKN